MDQKKIGEMIALRRRSRGLTQEKLGSLLGVTNKTVSRWENGTYMPDIALLKDLAAALGISVAELLNGELQNSAVPQQPEDELIAAYRESCFSRAEKERYWKKKWLREHISFIILCTIVCALPAWLGIYRHLFWPVMLGTLLALATYLFLRNCMMCYIEAQVFPLPGEKK